ncbi:MAG: pseudouridine-5'-phosphate glycosidase, partial [Desulfobulbaceae bacterium]|nr:pseudouridine-5'-phosphate glycosidase [Desulfobulbaceae bacterium]
MIDNDDVPRTNVVRGYFFPVNINFKKEVKHALQNHLPVIAFESAVLETVFDERGQLALGQYLYAQTLGRWQNAPDPRRESDIQLHIFSEDEHILRLP